MGFASFFPQQKVEKPTAANMNLVLLTAVLQKDFVVTAGLFQGVGQDRQALERTLVVDGLGQLRDRSALPRAAVPTKQPDGVEGNHPKRIPKQVTEECGLHETRAGQVMFLKTVRMVGR